MAGHDIIAMVASSGGVGALCEVTAALPADLPAAVFVVVHVDAAGPHLLPDILARAGPLTATAARHGEAIEQGRIYVAPPDFHLVVDGARMHLKRAPRENRARPAADPLFRSAARAFGPRVVGVVLTGTLDDGSAGLLAIKARGGVAVVQDPADALFPEMPRSALQRVAVDHCVPLRDLPDLLVRLARTPPQQPAAALPEELAPAPSGLSCPKCHGVLFEHDHEAGVASFVCRIGHAFGPASLLAEQSDELEAALWGAVRALEESAVMERRIAHKLSSAGLAQRHEDSAAAKEEQARLLREMILGAGVDAAIGDATTPEVSCGGRDAGPG